MTGAIIDAKGARIGMVMPLVGYIISITFPIYLNIYKAKELDAYRSLEIGIKNEQKRQASIGNENVPAELNAAQRNEASEKDSHDEKAEIKEIELA
jgi:MFS transporter, FHS family, L-fucose permease